MSTVVAVCSAQEMRGNGDIAGRNGSLSTPATGMAAQGSSGKTSQRGNRNNGPPHGRYSGSGGGYDRDRDYGDRESNREKFYGMIIASKDTFGFICPYSGEDHIYFSFRDGPRNNAVGTEVEYSVRQGPKGPTACNVREIDESKVKIASPPPLSALPAGSEDQAKGPLRHRGLVSWEIDPYKNTPGIITLLTTQPNLPTDIAFVATDISKNRRIAKGDEVEFDLQYLPGTQYAHARDISVFRTKRARQIAEQIQMFTKAGVLQEQGVIDAIKGDYGFIKSCDRAEQLFFRLDDIVDETIRPNESDEVAFYVISEVSRGKMSDRAVHISFLPHGTVIFEKVLTQDILAYVSSEPKCSPNSRQEEPGMLRLLSPLEYNEDVLRNVPNPGSETKTVTHVELWGRCMPDGIASSLRLGDLLKIDAIFYRPEKLIFARNVRIEKYRSLGRLHGVVCEVKEGRGYGFIKCQFGGPDTYFKVGEVLRPFDEVRRGDSPLLDERNVKSSLALSYECSVEEVGGGEVKLRATRVVAESSNYERKAPMLANLRGCVTKEPKRDAPGTLSIIEGQELNGIPIGLPSPQDEMRAAYSDIYSGIEEVANNPDIKEVILDYVLPRQRFAIHELIRIFFSESCIAHQTVLDSRTQTGPIGKGQKVRLWKIDNPEEFKKWTEEDALRNRLGKAVVDDKNDEEEDGEGDLETEPAPKSTRKSNRVYFLKGDLSDSSNTGALGSVRTGAIVDFDLCVDKLNGTRVAANVRVSDEAVGDGGWPQLGIVEYIREGDGSGAAGYIRSIPHDEKLPWISSQYPLTIGTIVCFEIRNRGGVRYSNRVTPIHSIEENAPSLDDLSEKVLTCSCIGVVIATHDPSDATNPIKYLLHPLDFSSCPEVAKKFVDIPASIVKVHEKKRLMSTKANPSSESTWEKVNPEEESKTSKNNPQQTTTTKSSTLDGVPIFYPPLSMSSFPLDDTVDSSLCVPGTIVEFKPIVNWVVSRGLHGITDIRKREDLVVEDKEKSDSNNPASTSTTEAKGNVTPLALLTRSMEGEVDPVSSTGRVKGTIIRLTINVGGGMELAEISRRDGSLFYCESKELRFAASGNVHVGDEVEFLPASYSVKRLLSDTNEEVTYEIRVAVAPTLISQSRMTKKKPLPPSKPIDAAPPKPIFKNPITMAQGPPNDSALGFAVGWRGEEFKQSLQSLPWLSTLLPHLSEEGVC